MRLLKWESKVDEDNEDSGVYYSYCSTFARGVCHSPNIGKRRCGWRTIKRWERDVPRSRVLCPLSLASTQPESLLQLASCTSYKHSSNIVVVARCISLDACGRRWTVLSATGKTWTSSWWRSKRKGDALALCILIRDIVLYTCNVVRLKGPIALVKQTRQGDLVTERKKNFCGNPVTQTGQANRITGKCPVTISTMLRELRASTSTFVTTSQLSVIRKIISGTSCIKLHNCTRLLECYTRDENRLMSSTWKRKGQKR